MKLVADARSADEADMTGGAAEPLRRADWRSPSNPARSERVPAPPPFAPPASQPISPRPEPTTATEALDELVEVIPGAHGAVLASIDGFAIARSDTMPDEAAHAAMLAAAIGLAGQLITIGGGNDLRQLVVDHDEGLLLLWPIGADRVVSMLTDSRVDQARLRRFVRARARLLSESDS